MNKEKRERLEDAKEYVDMNHHQEGGELSKETCYFFSWLISELEQAWDDLESTKKTRGDKLLEQHSYAAYMRSKDD